VLELLARHKEGVLALLRGGNEEWSAEDWQAFHDERAAIVEVDGAMPERMWAAELAVLMAFTPGQRIADPVQAAQFFAAEALRLLDKARAEAGGAARVMDEYRRRGAGARSAGIVPPPSPPTTPSAPSSPRCGRHLRHFALQELEKAVARVANLTPGQHHGILHKECFLIGRFLAMGALKPGEIADNLIQAALSAGLPEQEVGDTVWNALRARGVK